jgi:hypothetical protein
MRKRIIGDVPPYFPLFYNPVKNQTIISKNNALHLLDVH